MKLNPLAVFTGLTLATFGALVYVERNTGSEEALTATAKVEPLAVPEPPKPAEPVVAEPAPQQQWYHKHHQFRHDDWRNLLQLWQYNHHK